LNVLKAALVLLMLCSTSFADSELDEVVAQTAALQQSFDEYVKAGDEFFSVEQYENALVSYKKAVDLKTGPGLLYQKMGDCSAKLGRYKEALVFAQRAVDVDPENAQLHLDLVMSFAAVKRMDEAKAALEVARNYMKTEQEKEDLAYIEGELNK
jgi:tetratricopeptide (TPR) repeat protein